MSSQNPLRGLYGGAKLMMKLLEKLVASQRRRGHHIVPRKNNAVVAANAKAFDVEQYLANVPRCERWLDNNSEAKASVERGLQQASQQRGVYIGSFAEYLELDTEQDED